jgi:hypothetical protein
VILGYLRHLRFDTFQRRRNSIMLTQQTNSGVSLHAAALVGGVGLLLMVILAIFAFGNVFSSVVIPNQALATVENLRASSGLFRLAIGSFLIVALLDVIVAWALYLVLKPVNPALSQLAAWFRLAYAPIFVAALGFLFIALNLATGTEYEAVLGAEALTAQVMLALNTFSIVWNMGLVVFGFHLLLAGYLAFKSGYVPKWLSLLLVIAGLGYVVDNVWWLLAPGSNPGVAQITGLGEAAFIFWLLWVGVRGRGKDLE